MFCKILIFVTLLGFSQARVLSNNTTQRHDEEFQYLDELCRYQIPGLSVQYPKDCSKFVVCLGNYIIMDCAPGGLYFDNNSQRCEWRQTVKCPDYVLQQE